MMIASEWQPPRRDLVRRRSNQEVNERIDRITAQKLSVVGYDSHAIRKRIDEIDREWNIDRALFAVFSILGSLSAHKMVQSRVRGHRFSGWRALFWTQMGFLLHHAIRGWCPPVSVLRRLGFRSAQEISAEREVLTKRLATAPGL